MTAGLSKIYLRGNSWDWFAQDDWRARAGLTIQFGVRYEYFSPYSEKYNRLVNLAVTGKRKRAYDLERVRDCRSGMRSCGKSGVAGAS